MCGIAGIVDLRARRDIDSDALRRMTAALSHRGPDGEGFSISPGVGFGHRRLAVIDPEGGAQPFKPRNRGGVLVYNGEIYNYPQLAESLQEKGVQFVTRSDTEVLAEGLAVAGADFAPRLRGMFAFAFWSESNETLILCRDRLGEKPLYYAVNGDGFLVFASEIGAVKASGLISSDLDPQAIADYFLYGFIPDPKSIYRNIRKLEPGSVLTAQRGAILQTARYWRPSFSIEKRSFKNAQEELLALLDDAVGGQMISDAPLGAFLSGGVDSSAIITAMTKASSNVTACAVGFENEQFDERVFARTVARRFGVSLFEDVARLNAADLIDEMARVYGEPFADASALPTWIVAKLARKHVTVALSGDGGDEIFAGYRRYPFFLLEEKMRSLAPLSFRKASFGRVGAICPKLDWAPRPLRLKTTFQALAEPRARAYAHAMAANRPERVTMMLSDEFQRALDGYAPESVVEHAMGNRNEHPLIAAQRADLATWLPGRMLTKIDRASMAHGVEVRAPMLDINLVEWAGRLDPSLKLRNGNGKRVLKAALERRLPRQILYRPKQGFSPPLAAWLRMEEGPLNRLRESRAWSVSGYFDPAAVEAMIKEHRRGVIDASQELWSLIMFDAFLRQI